MGIKNTQHHRLGVLTVVAASLLSATVWAQDTAQLGDVVVTATGFEQRIRNAPASITVITEEELAQKNFISLAEVLKEVPGVDVRNGTGKTGNLSIEMRGMPSQYTLILIDGRRQNTSGDVMPNGFSDAGFGFIPPLSAIRRIEVIRGPMSTLYGSDAMGGVINIITKPVSTREWGGNVTVQTELQQDSRAANSQSINIQTSGPLIQDKLGIELRGRFLNRESSARMNPNATGRDPRAGRGENYDVGAKLSWQLNDRNTLWADVSSAKQWYDNRDNRLGNQDTYDDEGNVINISTYRDQMEFLRDQFAFGVTTAFEFGEWENYVSQVRTETKGRTLPRASVPLWDYDYAGGEARQLKNTDTLFQSRLRSQLGNHSLTVGAEYQNMKTEDAVTGRGNTLRQNSWALFVEDSWQFMPRLNLTVGGRYENHKTFGGEFTPRAYLTWNTSDEWTLKGGVSQGYKVPTPNQLHDGLNGFGGQGRTVNLGSPHLTPEKTTNYEFSANYAKGSFDTTATVFLNKFKDKIATGDALFNCDFAANPNRPGCVSLGGFPNQSTVSQLVNIDSAETKGIELASRFNLTSDWSVKGAYTWMKTETKSGRNQGSYLVNAPRHALNLSTQYNVNERLSTWLEAEYKSSRVRYAGSTAGDEAIMKELSNNQFKGYTIVNFGANYQLNKQLRLTAGIHNLLDKKFDKSETFINSSGEEQVVYLYSASSNVNAGTYIDRRKLWVSLGYDF
ncbi:MAG: TonB-dependent receptor [Neisseriaceae bacterium]|nr:TonB-dependent receptor [Neisseriaceae bacterium]MBP6862645.1 TonB-dependent receptor [Neisseriaceae bacterium]